MAKKQSYTANEIVLRYDGLKADRATWETHWQDVADFLMPYKNSITRSQHPGQRRNDDITNDTATQDNDKLASGIFGFLCPPKEQWFLFNATDLELQEMEEVQEYYNKVSRLVMEALYASNYALQMHEDLQDLGAFGTSCLHIEKGSKKPLRFKSIPIQNFVMAENADGEIDTVLQKFKLTARQLAQKFKYKDLSAKTRKIIDKGGPEMDKKIDIIHAVMPRSDLTKGKITSDNLPIMSMYVEVDAKKIIENGGYHEMAYIAGRFMKSSDETYGRGPGITCLPRVKMVNRMGYTIIRNGEKQVDPPTMFPDDGVVSDPNMNPGAIVYIRASYYENKPVTFEHKARLDIGLELLDREEQAIHRAFYTELFDTLQDRRNMTATEVAERVSEKLLLFIPIMARIQAEKITPMLERCLGIMMRNNMLPPPPEVLLENPDYDIKYVGKMALALKGLDVSAFVELLAVFKDYIQFAPEMLKNIDWDKAFRGTALRKAVPVEFLRTKKELAVMAEAEAKQAKEQALMDKMTQGADALSKLQKTTEPGSPAEAIGGAMPALTEGAEG